MIKKLGLLGVLSFATLGAFMLFSPGKASASVVDCGTSNWGITTGNTSSDAGLIIHAQLSNGTEVNVSYRLVDVSSPNNYSIWRATNGTNSTNYSSLTRSTGSDFYTSSSGSTAHCDGYDVYGYGTSGSNGNRYALDCHQVTSGGSYTTATAYFQIQSVAAPAGHPYGSWSGDNATFTVTNGGNKTITLTWTDATVPVSGKVYDGANSVGIPSVRIVVCGISANNYTAADTTDSAGNWAVTIKKGNQFCVRLTQTSSTNATLLTPAGYDPNVDAFQRSEHSTANSYEQQSAGVSCYHDTSPVFGCDGYPSTSYSTANTTYDWDLGDANNFRFYKWVTVSGRLYNGATNAGFANVTIVSCGSNPSDTTDANGNWSIRVRQTTRFCVHPQVSGVAFSPGSGYTPVAVNAPTEHSTGVQYEYQVAAMNCYHDTSPPPGCQNPAQTGAASNNSDYYWDRAITSVSDTGYDIKYTPPNTPADTPPTVTITPNCGSRNAVINVNDPNGGTSTISYSIDGVAQPSQTTNSYTVNMSGYDQTVPHTINASSPGTPPSGGTVGAPVNAAPATYGQGSGGCVSPDSPPTITISPSCANKNAVITVNDPNGGTSTITYNIDGGSNQSQTANSITVNMSSYDQYKPHTINASSPGVPPSGGTVGPPVSSTATYGQGGARGCTDGVFTITPNGSTNLLPNQEDPTSVTFGATLTTVANPSYPPNAIPVTVFRDFYFVKYNTAVEIPLLLSTTTVTTADQPLATVTANPASGTFAFGDQVCTRVTVSPASGTTDSSGGVVSVVQLTATTNPPVCQTIGNLPYFRVYGGDVYTGGVFNSNGTCGATTNGLLKAETSATKGTSATELAAYAVGIIEGFGSAALRTTAPTLFDGLTYTNTTSSDGNLDSTHCVADYFSETLYPTTDSRLTSQPATTTSVTIDSTFPADRQTYFGSGPITISQTSIPATFRHTIYIDGDAIITSDIKYDSSNNPSFQVNNMPYFTLVVRGNIYIANTVSRLNGVYIAQPLADGTKGQIFTCRTSTGGRINNSDMPKLSSSGGCANQLLVTGVFIAKQVLLQRTFGTLRDGLPRETAAASKAAEIFQGSPDLQIGSPVFDYETGNYDSVKSLPPVI